jgi:hypothetical protein
MATRIRNKLISGLTLAIVLALLLAPFVLASSVDESIVDTTAPTGSVTLAPGGSAPITINLTVTGKQDGTATFDVYRDWKLSGGNFTGSNPQTFNVPPREAQDTATTFSASGTITIDAGQADGTFTLAVGAFNITNSNSTGAKLAAGGSSSYQVTVSAPPPPSDTTPPEISYKLDPASPDGDNGWYKSDVTLTWTVTEGESPDSLVTTGCVDQNITADQPATTYSCSATSAGGSAGPESVTIKRDATLPTISGDRSPDANAYGWNDTDVAVSFQCEDNLSGVASCGPDQTLSSEGAGQSVTGKAVDEAGNSASTIVDEINIDKTVPTISAGATTDPNSAGWYNHDVTVHFTCADGLAGIADGACPADQVLSDEGAAVASSAQTVMDKAGNTSDPSNVVTVSIDKTAPGITWNGSINNGDEYYFGFVPPEPACTATDALSGPNGCDVSGYATTVGVHKLTATAHDVAGNQTVETRSYEVLAWTLSGFYQPVDMPTPDKLVYNMVKNGSTVPLKFDIFAGPTELADLSDIKSLTYAQTACDANATTDEIETTATGGTSLRYDLTAGQFVYNWKTPSMAGKCYRVTMTTLDGSSLAAFFKLK